jgi:hypothetical protein
MEKALTLRSGSITDPFTCLPIYADGAGIFFGPDKPSSTSEDEPMHDMNLEGPKAVKDRTGLMQNSCLGKM